MYIPKEIRIKNFLGYKNAYYAFNQGKTTLIQGINESDSDDIESNGSGKSSFQEAILFAIEGSGSKKEIVDKDLIHRGESEAEVDFTLHNAKLKHDLRIVRTLPIKGSQKLDIYINGDIQRDKYATIPLGNKYILELLDISSNDLRSYYLVNRSRYVSFFRSSDRDKKEFIGRFSKADMINAVYDKVNEKYEEIKIEQDKQKSKSLVQQELIETYKSKIEELKSVDYGEILKRENEELLNETMKLHKEWEFLSERLEKRRKEDQEKLNDYNKTLDSLKKQLENSNYLIEAKETQIKIDQLEISYKELSERYKEAEKNVADLKSKEQEEENELKKALQDIQDFRKEFSRIELLLEKAIECPKCGNKFILNSDESLEELHVLQNELIQAVKECEEDEAKRREKIKGIEIEVHKLTEKYIIIRVQRSEIDSKIEEKRREISSLQNKYNEIQRHISSLQEEILHFQQAMSYEAEEKKLKDNVDRGKLLSVQIRKLNVDELRFQNEKKIDELRKEIKSSEKTLKLSEKKVLTLQNELNDVNKWNVNFQRFYTFLTNRSLKSIQDAANVFLQRMRTNLAVQIEGYKLLASGDLREKISAWMVRNGEVEGNVFVGSCGEISRLEVAMIVACQNIINQQSYSGGLDLLLIDEVLDGVDPAGIKSILDSMNYLEKTIFLISQIQLKTNFANILTVCKRNGVCEVLSGVNCSKF